MAAGSIDMTIELPEIGNAVRRSRPISMHEEAENFEQHLRARLGGVRGRVILRGDLDEIGTDEIRALEAAQDRHRLSRRKPSHLGRAGAWRESGVEAVDVEGEIGWPLPDDGLGPLDDRLDSERIDLLGMDDRHARIIGELPQIFGRAPNADLDGSARVERAVEHGATERAAVMEFAPLE